ncbi:hypothetical protein JTB14_021389 [Gonioctena quinquepunctata]|nr:hypothetical protein JTB14_021389 [Gonioctena quinquepunctata]
MQEENEANDRSKHETQCCTRSPVVLLFTGGRIIFWYPKVPRVRVRKTSRGQIELSRYRDAYEEVKAGDSLRNAADKHGINHCSLLRYMRKRDASGEDDQVMGYRAHNRIFNEEQEQ